jgi:hypothetical protein
LAINAGDLQPGTTEYTIYHALPASLRDAYLHTIPKPPKVKNTHRIKRLEQQAQLVTEVLTALEAYKRELFRQIQAVKDRPFQEFDLKRALVFPEIEGITKIRPKRSGSAGGDTDGGDTDSLYNADGTLRHLTTADTDTNTAETPRRRGRPAKPKDTFAADAPKRGRGRPPKQKPELDVMTTYTINSEDI